MKRLLLAPLLLTLISCSKAESTNNIHQQCLKALDYSGCVKTLSENQTDKNSKKITADRTNLIKEIKKFKGRITLTSSSDYPDKLQDFLEALAVSTPESVGEELYQNATTLAEGSKILVEVWERSEETKDNSYALQGSLKCTGKINNLCWSIEENKEFKKRLDNVFKGNTFENKCWYRNLLWKSKTGMAILDEVVEVLVAASEMILEDNKFSFPTSGEEPLIKTNDGSITWEEYYNETRKPYLAECPSK